MISTSYIFGRKYSTLDSDAQAFITATAITDSAIINAINNLVVSLKSNSLWDKMKVIYPFVGGVEFTHKFNLKDPRNLDSAFRLSFNGTFIHSSNGIQGDGISAYANTFFIPSTHLLNASQHISIYSLTDSLANIRDSGSYEVTTSALALSIRWTNSICYMDLGNNFTSDLVSNSLGHFLIKKNTSSLISGFKNGNLLSDESSVNTISNRNVYISALNNNNTPIGHSNRIYAFFSLGFGFTNTEVSNYYTIVQAFQTALGRNV